MTPTIIRIAYLPEVTLGRFLSGATKLWTLEEPWRPDPDGPGGQRREGALLESCIPDGDYRLEPHNGTVWQKTWRFENPALGVYGFDAQIPAGAKFGRSTCLMHSGVDVRSILGCVLVGLAIANEGGRYVVKESVTALAQLRAALVPGTRHNISIRPSTGTSEVL